MFVDIYTAHLHIQDCVSNNIELILTIMSGRI